MTQSNIILLVDDDYMSNFVFEKVLEKSKLPVTLKTFMSGHDALEYLEETYRNNHPVPDYIFLDLHMPDINGGEFTKVFSKLFGEENKVSKIVLITALHNPVRNYDGSWDNAFIDAVIEKPITVDKLKKIIK